MKSLIKVDHIKKSFKNSNVLTGIDLNIYSGEVVAVVGPNGAGKTTLINIILGIIKPDSGNVSMWRDDYKPYIGVQLQSTPFFEGYNAKDNLLIFSALYNIKINRKEIDKILNKYGLNKNTTAIKLSGGEQKKLALAVATMHNPKLLILDEPTSGLDPRERHNVRNMIRSLSKKNITVLFTSHDLEEVRDVANRIVILYRGRIIADGNEKELLEKHNTESLEKLYLSLTEENVPL